MNLRSLTTIHLLCLSSAIFIGCVEPEEKRIDDQGIACINDGKVHIDFQKTVNSSCNILKYAQCSVTRDGSTLNVTSKGVISYENESDCTTELSYATATCTIPDGDIPTTVVYGGKTFKGDDLDCQKAKAWPFH